MPSYTNKLADVFVDIKVDKSDLKQLKPMVQELNREISKLNDLTKAAGRGFGIMGDEATSAAAQAKRTTNVFAALGYLGNLATNGIGGSSSAGRKKGRGTTLSKSGPRSTVSNILSPSPNNIDAPWPDHDAPSPRKRRKSSAPSPGVAPNIAAFKQIGGALKSAQAGAAGLSSALSSALASAGPLAAALVGIGASVALLWTSVSKFKDAEDVLLDFKNALEGIGKRTEENTKRGLDFSNMMEASSRIDDEVVMKLQTHAIKMGICQKQSEEYVKTAIGLAKEWGGTADEMLDSLIKLGKGMPAKGLLKEGLGKMGLEDSTGAGALAALQTPANKGLKNEAESKTTLNGVIGTVLNQIDDVFKAIGQIAGPFVKGFLQGMQGFLDTILSVLSPLAEMVRKSEALQKALEYLGVAVFWSISPLLKLYNYWAMLAGRVIPVLISAFGWVIEQWTAFSNYVVGNISKAINSMWESFGRIVEVVWELVQNNPILIAGLWAVYAAITAVGWFIGNTLVFTFKSLAGTLLAVVYAIEFLVDGLNHLKLKIYGLFNSKYNDQADAIKEGRDKKAEKFAEDMAKIWDDSEQKVSHKGDPAAAKAGLLKPIQGASQAGEFRAIGETWKKVQEKSGEMRMQEIASQQLKVQEQLVAETKNNTEVLRQGFKQKTVGGFA